MGIFDRLQLLIKSNLNDIISTAEEPDKALNQTIYDLEDGLKDARRRVIKCMTAEKQLKLQYERALEDVLSWEHKAELAVRADNENLAREALRYKRKMEDKALAFRRQLHEQQSYIADLKVSLEALEAKLGSARNHKESLSTRIRYRRDLEHRRETSYSNREPNYDKPEEFGTAPTFNEFDRMEDKILGVEAEVEAIRELSNTDFSDPGRMELDRKLSRLDREEGSRDSLAELRRRLREG